MPLSLLNIFYPLSLLSEKIYRGYRFLRLAINNLTRFLEVPLSHLNLSLRKHFLFLYQILLIKLLYRLPFDLKFNQLFIFLEFRLKHSLCICHIWVLIKFIFDCIASKNLSLRNFWNIMVVLWRLIIVRCCQVHSLILNRRPFFNFRFAFSYEFLFLVELIVSLKLLLNQMFPL